MSAIVIRTIDRARREIGGGINICWLRKSYRRRGICTASS
jgi:hypothetical protein